MKEPLTLDLSAMMMSKADRETRDPQSPVYRSISGSTINKINEALKESKGKEFKELRERNSVMQNCDQGFAAWSDDPMVQKV